LSNPISKLNILGVITLYTQATPNMSVSFSFESRHVDSIDRRMVLKYGAEHLDAAQQLVRLGEQITKAQHAEIRRQIEAVHHAEIRRQIEAEHLRQEEKIEVRKTDAVRLHQSRAIRIAANMYHSLSKNTKRLEVKNKDKNYYDAAHSGVETSNQNIARLDADINNAGRELFMKEQA